MAVGVEKLKDAGYQGVPATLPPHDGTARTLTAAAMYSMIAPAYSKKYSVSEAELRDALVRRRDEEPLQRRPQPASAVPSRGEQGAGRARAEDGWARSACSTAQAWRTAVRRRSSCEPRMRARFTDKPLYVKALSLVAGNGSGLSDPNYDYTTFPEVVDSAEDAYNQAGITDPRAQLAMAEVHDCFTPTEMVLMEDLGFAERGTAWKEILAGTFDLDGDLPVNPDGGLKSFGHPVGASGSADDVRVLAPTAGRGARGPPARQRPQARVDAQPRRLSGRDGLVRVDPRF